MVWRWLFPLSVRFGSRGDAVSVGLYIAPVDRTAMPVVEHDSGRLLTPASIMKSLTMATALELLGPDFRWNTRVMAHGNLSHDGTLNGDIVIIGSGDPTLESRHFKEHPSFVASLVNAVSAHGIKTIRGKIRIYDAAVPSWRCCTLVGSGGYCMGLWCRHIRY